MKRELGIIGFGRFGQFLAKWLKDDFEISAFDLEKKAQIFDVKQKDFATAAGKPFVILAAPIRAFEATLKEIVPHFKPGTLLLDVCSVKEKPASLMAKIVPKSVDVVATHPMFGPDSAKDSIKGKAIVLCPIRISKNKLAKLENFLESKGLDIVKMTPTEHDKLAAKSQAITHFIARALELSGNKATRISTPSHLQLTKIADDLSNDSEALFFALQNENRFANEERANLIAKLIELDKKLNKLQP